MMYAYALGGFVLLFGGGEWLVRGAIIVARRFNLSPLLIGMTVVAFCTSAPELVVSIGAALDGQSEIAIGNVVGSNIFNILGVLGISALIAPVAVKPCELRRDTTVLIGSTVLIVALSQFGVLTRPMGAVLFAGIIAYVWLSYRSELKNPQLPSAHLHAEEAEEVIEVERPKSVWIGVALLVGGLAALVVGSRLLISGATDIALTFGVPQAVIGLTLVAIGTSLPELATSVIAAVRRHSDVAVGNVVGSGIFNLLAILGMTALVKPIGVADRIAHVDVWVMLAVTLALAPFLLIRGRIGRVAGGVAVGLYIVYAGLLLAGGAV